MKIDLPIKIHNKFEVEVKDVATGEIVQKGYAENIILDIFFTSQYVLYYGNVHYAGYSIAFGDGQGEISSERVALFNWLGTKASGRVEYVINEVPLPSYATKKIVIRPEEFIGRSLTEVGVAGTAGTSAVYTHALIRDSAGNLLTLEPKTGLQEITIYSTIYFVPLFNDGFSFKYGSNPTSALVEGFVGWDYTYLRDGVGLGINGVSSSPGSVGFAQNGAGSLRRYQRLGTSSYNTKIKKLYVGQNYSGQISFNMDLEILAENNSSIWSGWEFDKIPIGTGDGATTEFPLPWNEAWLDKPKTIYVDGVATAVTWTEDTITFVVAPVDQAPITGSYWVKYVPKDEDHVLDITIDINYAEGVTT